ncbi:MAG: PH domain-containing protein [bacterium]
MGYVEENLLTDESIITKGRLHWILFLGPAIMFLIAIIVASNDPTVSPGFFFIAIVWLLKKLIDFYCTELAITDKRVIVKFGFIRRNTIELNHSKVESLNIDQGIIGRLLNFGTIKIHGTGSGTTPVPKVEAPLQFRRVLNESVGNIG